MPSSVAIACSRLPAAFDGMRVAVISDHHAKPGSGATAARRVVEAVNALQADVVVLLGDMVHRARHAGVLLAPLSELSAREGVYACLGNHEHGIFWYSRYLGPTTTLPIEEWRELYAGLGVELLVNEARPVTRGRSRLWIIGVDDAYSGKDDLSRALNAVPDGEFRLAVTHSPDLLDDFRAKEVDLILAGHTHGGQIRLPPIGAIWAPCRKPRERAAGLIRDKGALAYVSRGVGEGIPIRVACPRELPVIELRSSP